MDQSGKLQVSQVQVAHRRIGLHLTEPPNVQADAAGFPDDAPVLGVEFNGEARAYPVSIFGLNHVVNDRLGGVPVLVVYCPSCLSGLAFHRNTGGEELSFAVYGRLHHRVVTSDFETGSLWTEEGEAISGPLAGRQLVPVPMWNVPWRA